MKITYTFDCGARGYLELDYRFCCDKMGEFYDMVHNQDFCITLGRKSGKLRLIGGEVKGPHYSTWKHIDISYCPFCGEKIEAIEIPSRVSPTYEFSKAEESK